MFQVLISGQTIEIASAEEAAALGLDRTIIDVRSYWRPHPRMQGTVWAPRDAAAAIDRELENVDEITVHCEWGFLRSPVTVAVFLIHHRDLSLSSASHKVKAAFEAASASVDPQFDAWLPPAASDSQRCPWSY